MKASELIAKFEQYCPQELAEAGDPVGLHIGTLDKEVHKVMITLDVRPETVAEAIYAQVDLLIAKHPPIFRPIKRLDTQNPQNKMYADLLQHNIAVYAAHTNIDIIEDGLNDWFCTLLGIEKTEFLHYTHTYQGRDYGLGRVGDLPSPLSLSAFAEKVKTTFSLDALRIVQTALDKPIQRVAICGGSGEKFYPSAIAKKADVYVTGDIYYHTAHDMQALGLAAIDPGHHIEALFTTKITELFNQWKEEQAWDVEIIASKKDTNPFVYR